LLAHFREFNAEAREASSTVKILNKGKQLNVDELLENETNLQMQKRAEYHRVQWGISLVLFIIHSYFAMAALYLLLRITNNKLCLVKWGFVRPLIIYLQKIRAIDPSSSITPLASPAGPTNFMSLASDPPPVDISTLYNSEVFEHMNDYADN